MKTSGRSGAKRPRPKREISRSGTKRADITLIVEEKLWRSDRRALALVRRAVGETLVKAARRPRALTILLSGDAHLKELNALFRGRAMPTNVLSFPASGTNYLGDVAIAYGVAAREARAEGKPFAAHAAHLAVHGVLHLLGYDHENAREAQIMEALEARILARLGLADPYAPIREAA
jgi:probable rRNA maturation factor